MVLSCNMFFIRYFCHKKLFYNVVQTWSEISSSLRLSLKVCVWYRCQNRIENYYDHDGGQLTFYKILANLRLVKLVVMTNVFFNYHQHEIEIKRLICVK